MMENQQQQQQQQQWSCYRKQQQKRKEGNDQQQHRHLGLFDLVMIGIGSTVGSGIFVLTGYIAHNYAGPATWISFLISGIAACCSGVCYAELSGKFPTSGSSYLYAKTFLGKPYAVVAGACLTLEYAVSGAAVARSWGDKVALYWNDHYHNNNNGGSYYYQDDNYNNSSSSSNTIISMISSLMTTTMTTNINWLACLVCTLSTMMLLYGVRESKKITNFFTMLKIGLVLFMIIYGFSLFDITNIVFDNDHDDTHAFTASDSSGNGAEQNDNNNNDNDDNNYLISNILATAATTTTTSTAAIMLATNTHARRRLGSIASSSSSNSNYWFISLLKSPYGNSGIIRGSTSSFFAYLGYDEVCCVAGEAIHPRRDMPRAVLYTLCITTTLYILASIALVGIVPYTDISNTSAFPEAFSSRNQVWAQQIAAIGELVTLPIVVLISVMPQSRLFEAIAQDGLLPSIFLSKRSTSSNSKNDGNLFYGTLISGVAMTIVATFVPFDMLDDFISVGILLAFNITNSCLILMRCSSHNNNNNNKNNETIIRKETQIENQQEQKVETSPLLLKPMPTNSYNIRINIQQKQQHNNRSFFSLTQMLQIFNALCCVFGLLCNHHHHYTILVDNEDNNNNNDNQILLLGFVLIMLVIYMGISHPPSSNNNSNNKGTTTIDDNEEEEKYFETPFLPYLPCFGMLINWYLITQLELLSLFVSLLFVIFIIGLYRFFVTFLGYGRNDHNSSSNFGTNRSNTKMNSNTSFGGGYNSDTNSVHYYYDYYDESDQIDDDYIDTDPSIIIPSNSSNNHNNIYYFNNNNTDDNNNDYSENNNNNGQQQQYQQQLQQLQQIHENNDHKFLNLVREFSLPPMKKK